MVCLGGLLKNWVAPHYAAPRYPTPRRCTSGAPRGFAPCSVAPRVSRLASPLWHAALRCITLSCCISSLWCLHLLPLRTGLSAAPCILMPHVAIFCHASLQCAELQCYIALAVFLFFALRCFARRSDAICHASSFWLHCMIFCCPTMCFLAFFDVFLLALLPCSALHFAWFSPLLGYSFRRVDITPGSVRSFSVSDAFTC